jgi:hypothetical protein
MDHWTLCEYHGGKLREKGFYETQRVKTSNHDYQILRLSDLANAILNCIENYDGKQNQD